MGDTDNPRVIEDVAEIALSIANPPGFAEARTFDFQAPCSAIPRIREQRHEFDCEMGDNRP